MEVMSNPPQNYFHTVQSVADTHIHTYVTYYLHMYVRIRASACVYVRMQFGKIKWGSNVGINENEKYTGL
jgi:hypothetical protein